MLVDEERTVYGKSWKDNELEELSKSVLARLPNISTKQAGTSESGSIDSAHDAVMSAGSATDTGGSGPAYSITSGSEESKSHMEVSPLQGKRRASPTELPKQDKRGDMRMSKRPSIKHALRSSDEEGLAAASRCVEDVVLTPRRGDKALVAVRH